MANRTHLLVKTCLLTLIYQTHDHFIEILNDKTFWSLYRFVKSPADGHCLIHSLVTVLESLNHEIKDCSTLLYNLRCECIYNYVMYLQYFDGDINEFLYEMEQHINHGVSGTGFCDIVPVIMANVLKIPIIIIDKTYIFYQVFVNYPPDEKYCINASFSNSYFCNLIVLCRFKYHYDAYVKLQSSVSYPNENILSDTRPTLERRQTLGRLRSIYPDMINHFASLSKTC